MDKRKGALKGIVIGVAILLFSGAMMIPFIIGNFQFKENGIYALMAILLPLVIFVTLFTGSMIIISSLRQLVTGKGDIIEKIKDIYGDMFPS